jgi:formylglycine-generating enzyme required for sulfatase activity
VLLAGNLTFHLEAHFKGAAEFSICVGFAVVVLLISLIAGRIIPSFTRNWRDRQAIIELPPGTVSYRVNGDFTRAGRQAAAPLVAVSFHRPLAIMKHQNSSADYQACVDDGASRALDRGVLVAADRPAVQISWHDANGYATWLSRKTGETYRLPTDEEWAFAAGTKFKDDGISVDENDPSKRWIARYEREADRAPSDAGTRAFGSFGSNESNLQDVGGNVWERTATCFVRRVLDNAENIVSESPNCGVRLVEGQHRAYVTDFIRDAKAGGCAVGVPLDNLGFRLVVELANGWACSTSSAAPRLS